VSNFLDVSNEVINLPFPRWLEVVACRPGATVMLATIYLCIVCLQLHSAAAIARDKKVAAALADAEDANRALVARLKADVQRKASLLHAAKADSKRHHQELQDVQQEAQRLRGLLASSQGPEPTKGLQQDVSQKQTVVAELATCVQSLTELSVRAAASMHLGADRFMDHGPCSPIR
jgi:hypothetical protein